MGSYKPTRAGQYALGDLGGRPCATWIEDGTRRRFRLAAGPVSQAEAEALLQTFARSRDRMVEARGAVTVQRIVDAYLADKKLDGNPTKNQETSWKALKPTFGALVPAEIDKAICKRYEAQRLAKGRKSGTVWTELTVLRTFLNWAVTAKMLVVAPHITIPPKPEPRDIFLSRDELDRLLDCAGHPHIRLYIVLAVATAGRMGALLDLTWDRVDFDTGMIKLHNPDRVRTHKGRAIVPMNNSLRAALAEAKPGAQTNHVIEWLGSPCLSVKKGIAAAAARAKVRCSPHTLRHTAGRFMAEAGVPMEEIASYMGHSTPAVTYRVYARFSSSYLRKAADALELRPVRRAKGS